MRLSFITLLPIALSLASFANAYHELRSSLRLAQSLILITSLQNPLQHANEARKYVNDLSSRGFYDYTLERREVLEDIATLASSLPISSRTSRPSRVEFKERLSALLSQMKISPLHGTFRMLKAPAQSKSPSPLNIVTDGVDGTDNHMSIHPPRLTDELEAKLEPAMVDLLSSTGSGAMDQSGQRVQEGRIPATNAGNASVPLAVDATPIPTNFDQELGVVIIRRAITNPRRTMYKNAEEEWSVVLELILRVRGGGHV
ncbi:hypothetical protein DFP72DRAFT_1176471 [Ephemerocybe angulata]|uniref:Uncharacterized protein n=1 Tax=Ephemerocybe angulata TaxID=980116 RepID=A0A8H6HES2_9AGAR|nr:hypothetical protein DFP72DRAFT_1176471 [Tulosesus angulatus]